jgi:hypothetical protein
MFVASNIADDIGVDGKTFQAYSMLKSNVNLDDRLENHHYTSKASCVLHDYGVTGFPSQERDLLRIPGIELIMKRPSEQDTNQV